MTEAPKWYVECNIDPEHAHIDTDDVAPEVCPECGGGVTVSPA